MLHLNCLSMPFIKGLSSSIAPRKNTLALFIDFLRNIKHDSLRHHIKYVLSGVLFTVLSYQSLQAQHLVGHYPFEGNASDLSGYQHHGTAINAVLSPDRNGNPNSAYTFVGAGISKIEVNDSPTLNLTSNFSGSV